MSQPKKKMSNAKMFALVVSIALHAGVIYYLGTLALDYALPQGEVTSYEMDFSKGTQTETTQVDVVDSVPATPPPPAAQPPSPPKPSEPKPVPPKAVEKPAQTLPTKVAAEPVQDHQGDVPVATEVPEDTHKELMEEPKSDIPPIEPPEVAQDAPPQVIPTPAPSAPVAETQAPVGEVSSPAAAATTSEAYGTPDGVQSDTVLTPYGSNRPISYPTMARFRKLEGVTLVHYTVSAEGAVTDVKVIESSGHAILDNQAVDTIKHWKFKPTGKEGVYERPIRYSLKGDAKEAPSQLRRLGK